MTFTELLFFLGLLPISVAVSLFDRSSEYKNLILVLTSVIFVCWAKPLKVCLIFLTVISEYLLGLGIEKTKPKNRSSAAVLLAVDLLINLGVFLWVGHNYLFPADSKLHLSSALIPIGVGYYTARGFSYCMDVFAGRCKAEKNIFCLITFMVSFHSFAAGPVLRYGETEPAIRKRSINGSCINDGLELLVCGLGKTIILSPVFGRIAEIGLTPYERTPSGALIGMLAFLAECWFTFTGLADIARAAGRLSGFDYPENYTDLTVTDGLTGFVKSANTTLIKLFEDFFSLFGAKSGLAKAIGSLAGAVLIALWYHMSKPFFAVGLCFGILLAIEKLFLGKVLKKIPWPLTAIYVAAAALVIAGGIYFKHFEDYKLWLGNLIGRDCEYFLSVAMKDALISNFIIIIIAFVIVCSPVKRLLMSLCEKIGNSSVAGYSAYRILKTAFLAGVLFICVINSAAAAVA